jgi:CRP/FNR family transcriptional regulator, cyclic AMP receptor protein
MAICRNIFLTANQIYMYTANAVSGGFPRDTSLYRHQRTSFFSKMTKEEFEALELEDYLLETKKGAYIYFEPVALNKIYFIKAGYIKIGYIDNEGKEIIKEIIQEGELFGQFTLEQDNLHGEFAQAYKGDVGLYAFTLEAFKAILSRSPAFAVGYGQQVGHKLRKAENRLVNVLNADVKTRLLRFFHDLVEHNKAYVKENSFVLDNFLTHDDIARLIGSSRQTVTSVLNEMGTSRLVKTTRKLISIPDVRAIQRLMAV